MFDQQERDERNSHFRGYAGHAAPESRQDIHEADTGPIPNWRHKN